MTDGANEAQTIRDLVLPALSSAGWPAERIRREYAITASKREVVGGRVRRARRLAADIVLVHPSGHPIAAVEAKKTLRSEYDGVQQAKDYGVRLGLPVVYATNGHKIIEIDLYAGTQHVVDRYRSADDLWAYFQARHELDALGVRFFEVPYSRNLIVAGTGEIKQMRYYQHAAVQAVLRAVASGEHRILTVLATGSGKSMLAAQLVHVLWEARWPRGPQAPDPRPRVLYVADRDVLVKDPLLKYFTPIFGTDEVHRIQGEAQTHKRIYFALYQALDTARLFAEYDRDFFDLVIVDECHRGSVRDDSAWREILDHFTGAIHLGMTATPRTDVEADNLGYFGNPVYTYSLKQGIEDGFLAPFQVIRAPLSSDVDGVHIPAGTRDADGNEVPEGDYGPSAFERVLVLPERTEAAAAFVSAYLERTDRMAKTIVFCVDQNHAARFVQAIGNVNSDLMATQPLWALRITSDEGDRGKQWLEMFQDGESPVPVVVASSDLLTTGVDAPMVRNIVFFTAVRSMGRFKQMLGRGTRIDEERSKEFFTVIDFTGVTARFEDPTFDGPVIRVVDADADNPPPEMEDDLLDSVVDEQVMVQEPEPDFAVQPGGELTDDLPAGVPLEGGVVADPDVADEVIARGRRFVLTGQDVYVLASMLFVVETSGAFRLRAVRIEDWVRDRVLDLGYDAGSLRTQWANAVSRRALTDALGEAIPLSLAELAAQLGRPEAEPLDLLLHIAFGAAVISRAERAARFTLAQRRFLDAFAEPARAVLDEVLRKYVEHGPGDLETSVLQVPPLSEMGSITELAGRFGGPERLRDALDEVNRRLFEAG